VPVLNGEPWLADVLAALLAQSNGDPLELLVVDDGSTDASCRIVREMSAADARLRLLHARGRGAAAAINVGVQAARYAIIGQVDQDVIVLPGWLDALRKALAPEEIGAVQGVYVPDREAPLLSRVMALDLALRYSRLPHGGTDHVCTGNVAYRAAALAAVGPLDERLGYGYDNDLSYRLVAAGYRLRVCPTARSFHRWRDDLRGYLVQQYGFGYGRLDLIAKHRGRLGGDAVSPPMMMAHPVVLTIALFLTAVGLFLASLGRVPVTAFALAGGCLVVLAAERLRAGIRAARLFQDPAGLWFPIVHLLRDLAWIAACVTWTARRACGRPPAPRDSMSPRPARSRD